MNNAAPAQPSAAPPGHTPNSAAKSSQALQQAPSSQSPAGSFSPTGPAARRVARIAGNTMIKMIIKTLMRALLRGK